ncbi:homoserine kinase [Candidatus Accumulibacter sp. ACC003]|jgi:homoserine kinase type II|uniref:homoserine kinase n=1 Tax=Candidatus Accumulibacter sp. ACC003 TaxID=2823334 RepID=UPI0025BEC6ED|nr:homoserine kinase [Candidatus Accumulibacter sp. ACC003]
MSVFTQLSAAQVAAWLESYSLGTLQSLTGISEGVQNSNFFLSTTHGDYVLTVFEQVPAAQVPRYVQLLAHLAQHGLPCPAPVADRSRRYVSALGGKPAVIVSRLAGRSEKSPNVAQCTAIGDMLARLHRVAGSWPEALPHQRDSHWCATVASEIAPLLDDADGRLLRDEVAHQQAQRPGDLPRGVIHADLFRDNALFTGDRLSGVLDFYFAGVDDLLFDLAVTVNDWCARPDGTLDDRRCAALLDAYHAQRPLLAAEHAAWPTLLRAAALRFWLSRLHDRHLPRAGELITERDPDAYRTILRARIASGSDCPWRS